MQHCESAIREGACHQDATKSGRQEEAFVQCCRFLQCQSNTPQMCSTRQIPGFSIDNPGFWSFHKQG